eukprot:5915108-Pyramimonas_sp.AAC.1
MQKQAGNPVPGPLVKDKNASLLVWEKDSTTIVSFIHWPFLKGVANRNTAIGREVMVEEGCFAFSVPAMFPQITFKSKKHPDGHRFTPVLADVGERMQQVRKHERPKVPDLALRAKRMCEVALSLKAIGPGAVAHSSVCALCGKDEES